MAGGVLYVIDSFPLSCMSPGMNVVNKPQKAMMWLVLALVLSPSSSPGI